MSRVVAWLRRNPTTLPFVILGVFVVLTIFRGESTRDQISRITTIVHQATCGGGHTHANLAACHRLCPNLSTISNLRCASVPKEVAISNGNQSPSGQPGPAGDGGAPGSNGDNGGANGTNPGPGISPPPPSAPAGNGNNPIGNALNGTTDAVNDALHNTNCIVNGLLSQSC